MTLAPQQQHKRARLIEAAISVLEHEEGYVATEEEIANQLHLSIEEYQEWLSDLRGLSLGTLENVGPESDPLRLLVYQTDSDPHSVSLAVQKSELAGLLRDAIGKMPTLERIILGHYYYEEFTLPEIAKRLDLPESRAGQLRSQAIIRLRSYLRRKHLRTAENKTHDGARQDKDRAAPSPASGEERSVSPGLEGSDAGQYVSSLIENPAVGILMATAAAFQNLETGRLWLFTASPALGNVAPVSLISTEAGRDIVANELGLIEHGMF